MDKYTIMYGGVIGRYHLTKRQNYQDAVRTYEDDTWIIGVVSDGCGSGKYSEVGANLLSSFILNSLLRCLNYDSLNNMIDYAIGRTMANIDLLIDNTYHFNNQERQNFIENNLLATVLGVVINKNKDVGMAFSIGDGTVVVDNRICEIDQNNAPHYLAYIALNQTHRIEYYPIESGFNRVGIMTDGVEVDKLEGLFATNRPVELKRLLNTMSEYGQHFFDDATCFLVKCDRNKNE